MPGALWGVRPVYVARCAGRLRRYERAVLRHEGLPPLMRDLGHGHRVQLALGLQRHS